MNQNLMGYTVAQVMPAALATGLFVSRCTIQKPDGVLVDAGEPSGNYVNVAGLVNIPCMEAPASDVRVQASETKSMEDIQAFSPLRILLGGYFPAVENGVGMGWRAIVDGTTLDILGAESDSQRTQTRFEARTSAV